LTATGTGKLSAIGSRRRVRTDREARGRDELEQRLLRRAAGRDAEAFGALVARHRTAALRVATVVLGAADAADDVVQEAALRAWRAAATIDPARSFRPWFFQIVANCARNDRRARGRRAALELRHANERQTVETTPEQRAVDAASQHAVLHALNQLDVDARFVIALRHFEELSEAEMAEVMGCARGTVKSRLSRAMTELRARLAQHDHDRREQERAASD
jgi:RNA polymerase sigma factor (sigma-70 family)